MADAERLSEIAADILAEWMSGYTSDDVYPQLKLTTVMHRGSAVVFTVYDGRTDEPTLVKVTVTVEEIA